MQCPGNGGMPALSVVRIVTDGDSPSARGGHSAAMAEDQVIIFGGSCYTSGGRFAYFNDTFTLDTEHHLWHNVACSGEAPTPRYGHSAFSVVILPMLIMQIIASSPSGAARVKRAIR